MRISSGSTAVTGKRCWIPGFSAVWVRSGSAVGPDCCNTTKNVITTAWADSHPPRPYIKPKVLLLQCLLDGEAYGSRWGFPDHMRNYTETVIFRVWSGNGRT